MPEIRQIQQNMVDEPCPVCSKGYMRPNGIVPSPGQYEHKCTNCDYTQTYTVRYPYAVNG